MWGDVLQSCLTLSIYSQVQPFRNALKVNKLPKRKVESNRNMTKILIYLCAQIILWLKNNTITHCVHCVGFGLNGYSPCDFSHMLSVPNCGFFFLNSTYLQRWTFRLIDS